ncbi:aryl-sulfate sulfotransferase [candidate division KSB1 bacterium]|nr:aryl-sulfate sulfotransferase [candidate division KSB1 bacterium]
MKNAFFIFSMIFIVNANLVLAQKPESIQYISPLHQSKLNSRSSDIIIRQGKDIDVTSLKEHGLIVVSGEKSGVHSGRVVLATDGKTVLFKPDSRFEPDEAVTVTVKPGIRTAFGEMMEPFTFQFITTPLTEPLNPYNYIRELDPTFKEIQKISQHLSKVNNLELQDRPPAFTLTVNGTPAPGMLFVSPTGFMSGDGYNMMIQNSGDVYYWKKITDGVPVDFKLLPNGLFSYGVMTEFYPFGGGGDTEFFMMDSSFNVVDRFQMGNGYVADFHEFNLLPNGNFLMVTYDLQEVDLSELAEGGHPGALVAGSIIQELDSERNVVFQWRSWDYYDVVDTYNDLSQPIFDAIHINSLEIDDDNNLLVSTLALAEVTKINRQTGEIIWRMGGKNNEFTFINDLDEYAPLYFMYQHDVRRLDNGNILLFDGGDSELRPWSRSVEYSVDEEAKTATNVWNYRHTPDLLSQTMGSSQRLDNGNTLICWGLAAMNKKPILTEVDNSGNIVLELKFDQYLLTAYRVFKFEWDKGKPVAEVMRQELLVGNTYEFDKEDVKTGVNLKFDSMGGFGYNDCTVKRYETAPFDPSFPEKAPMIISKRVTVDQFNIYSVNGTIYFDVDLYGFTDPASVIVYHREFEGRGMFFPLTTVFNPVTNKVTASMTRFGEFVFGYHDLESVTLPPLPFAPMDGQKVDFNYDVTLQWSPVGFVQWYQLQVATDPDFNNLIVDNDDLYEAIYTLESLTKDQDYYWRVKTFNDVGESAWSQVSSFTPIHPYIKVTVPAGGEQWGYGLEHFIQWEDVIPEDVIIELYKDDKFLLKIVQTYSTGAYRWEIPVTLDPGTNYKILVRSATRDIKAISAQKFTIYDPLDPARDVENKNHDMQFVLMQNYPNPFNAETFFSYEIPTHCHVSLKIYNTLGEAVATLVDEYQTANTYRVHFDGKKLVTGIYYYTLKAGKFFSQTRKMLVIK